MTNWKDIHEDFAKKPSWSNKTYQQFWEFQGFTYQEAQQWIQAGFKPNDLCSVYQWKDKNFDSSTTKKWITAGFKLNEIEKVKQWKEQGFTPEQAKSWMEVGLKPQEINFALYLKQNNYQPNRLSNSFRQIRKEFYLNYSPAQVCLNEHYPLTSFQTFFQINQDNKYQRNQNDYLLINDEKSCCLGTKIQLEKLVKEQAEIAKWDRIQAGMKEEEDINRLLSGNYWDEQIQNLQDDRLPLNKKQVTLQTRRRNYYAQLEVSGKQARMQQVQMKEKI